jgi:hypothetical protein
LPIGAAILVLPIFGLFTLLVDFVHKPAEITGQFQRCVVLRSEFISDRLLHNST